MRTSVVPPLPTYIETTIVCRPRLRTSLWLVFAAALCTYLFVLFAWMDVPFVMSFKVLAIGGLAISMCALLASTYFYFAEKPRSIKRRLRVDRANNNVIH